MIRAILGAPVTWGEVLAVVVAIPAAAWCLWAYNGFPGSREQRR